ncbi:MAG: hypothetical protein IJG63_02735 [Oscillospiraceae bacterium]|nr:hypothetical protein [Oscillospiraceae bacterium]
MSVSFEGMGASFVSMETSGSLTPGTPVKMSGNGKVSACSNGDRFMGVAVMVAADGVANVQVRGYVSMPYSGTAPGVGWAHLVSGTGGKVKADTGETLTGGEYLIVDVDSTNSRLGFVL